MAYDLIVIGGGPAGYVAAIRAAVKPLRELAQPLPNVRGSALYKRNMAVEIGARTLIRAWQKAIQSK